MSRKVRHPAAPEPMPTTTAPIARDASSRSQDEIERIVLEAEKMAKEDIMQREKVTSAFEDGEETVDYALQRDSDAAIDKIRANSEHEQFALILSRTDGGSGREAEHDEL